jgi:hypothetical protein
VALAKELEVAQKRYAAELHAKDLECKLAVAKHAQMEALMAQYEALVGVGEHPRGDGGCVCGFLRPPPVLRRPLYCAGEGRQGGGGSVCQGGGGRAGERTRRREHATSLPPNSHVLPARLQAETRHVSAQADQLKATADKCLELVTSYRAEVDRGAKERAAMANQAKEQERLLAKAVISLRDARVECEALRKQKSSLEGLCRAMQAERRTGGSGGEGAVDAVGAAMAAAPAAASTPAPDAAAEDVAESGAVVFTPVSLGARAAAPDTAAATGRASRDSSPVNPRRSAGPSHAADSPAPVAGSGSVGASEGVAGSPPRAAAGDAAVAVVTVEVDG